MVSAPEKKDEKMGQRLNSPVWKIGKIDGR
jgi:hypothetical protein